MGAVRQYGYLNELTNIAEDMEREAEKLKAAADQIRMAIVELARES